MTRQEYVEMLKEAIITAATKSSVAALVSQLPFLGPFRFILEPLIKLGVSFFVNKTEMAVFFAYTDLRTNAQAKEFEEAAQRNYHAQRGGNPDEIKIAETDLLLSFREFAKFNR